jgi:WD40 repeat protein
MAAVSTADAPSSFPWAKRGAIRGRSKDTALCCVFSSDDAQLIVGHYDGSLASYDLHALAPRVELTVQHGQQKASPITSLALRPTGKPVVLVATTDGFVDRYDAKSLERLSSIQEHDNEVYSCDYSPTGTHFITCGRDATVRVYSDATGERIREYRHHPQYSANTAALRLFCVRFDPQDANVFYSAGWGNVIHAHRLDDAPELNPDGDHRHGFFGAYITGEAMDVAKGLLVSASNRLDDQLQLWDLATRKPTTLLWPVQHRFLPNSARISPDAKFLAVGGGGGQGLKEGCFVMDLATGKPVVDLKLEKSVTSCAFGHREALVAFGDAEGTIHIYENRFAQRSS